MLHKMGFFNTHPCTELLTVGTPRPHPYDWASLWTPPATHLRIAILGDVDKGIGLVCSAAELCGAQEKLVLTEDEVETSELTSGIPDRLKVCALAWPSSDGHTGIVAELVPASLATEWLETNGPHTDAVIVLSASDADLTDYSDLLPPYLPRLILPSDMVITKESTLAIINRVVDMGHDPWLGLTSTSRSWPLWLKRLGFRGVRGAWAKRSLVIHVAIFLRFSGLDYSALGIQLHGLLLKHMLAALGKIDLLAFAMRPMMSLLQL